MCQTLLGCFHSTLAFLLMFINFILGICCLFIIAMLVQYLREPMIPGSDSAQSNNNFNERVNQLDLPKFSDVNDAEALSSITKAAKAYLGIVIIIFLTCFLGCVGFCLGSKIMLIVYIMLMLFMIIVVAVIYSVIIDGRNKLGGWKDQMVDKIKKTYKGLDSSDADSAVLNLLMIVFSCCGMNDYKDFDGAEMWKKSRNITLKNTVIPLRMEIPLACCSSEGLEKIIDAVPNNTMASIPMWAPHLSNNDAFKCATLASKNNVKDKGCYNAVWDIIEKATKSTSFTMSFVFLFVVMSSCVIIAVIEVIRSDT